MFGVQRAHRQAETDLYSPAIDVHGEMVEVPAGPGWGIEINPDWLAQADRRISQMLPPREFYP
jgi:L-alanine-DL-glutamate epimerase-like enolase superfamily enzyme